MTPPPPPPTPRASSANLGIVVFFALTTLQSAFLIFLVQPMVGKHILPWFGGVPTVWSLCLAFYQSTLFAGYAYAHWLERRIRPAVQIAVHGGVFLAALIALPVLPDSSWKPQGTEDPIWAIASMLTVNVALPFLFLASQGPLLQAWFVRAGRGRSPYPLYAVSNLGSLLALVSFPLIAEPSWPLSTLSRFWSGAFVVAGTFSLACAWLALGSKGTEPLDTTHTREGSALDPLSASSVVLWIALPACAVTLLMGVTNELCLNVASVPFLWIVPLCIYLSTFILCFGAEWLYDRGFSLFLLALAIGIQVVIGRWGIGPESWVTSARMTQGQIVLYSIGLFAACMLLHGELYRLRPAKERLTTFYLCVSGGGALGGLFVGLAAPHLFNDYLELPLGALAALVTLYAARRLDPSGWLHTRSRRFAYAGAIAMLVTSGTALTAARPGSDGVLHHERNFFSVLRVIELAPHTPRANRYTLISGTTMHGSQLRHPNGRGLPTNYFGEATGLGFALRSRAPGRETRVGVIGLGIGTVAAYGRAGDLFRFYEIDPTVVELATDGKFFSFLSASPANIEIAIGDGRLSLEAELSDDHEPPWDVLIVDAFSSDAIPVHLLTVEAFRIYRNRLSDAGLIVLHLSNNHLDLAPVALRMASEVGLHAIELRNVAMRELLSSPSIWVVASPSQERIDGLTRFVATERKRRNYPTESIVALQPDPNRLRETALWSDDYSDLISVLRTRTARETTSRRLIHSLDQD
jgi:spermidine synthase